MTPVLADMLVGTIIIPIIDIINSRVTSSAWRFRIAIMISLFAGAIANINLLQHGTPEEFLGSLALVVATSQAMYKKMYEDSRVQTKLTSLMGRKR